ncbi:hypothetical protein PIB30_091413 [Stylosanthes scabra]|uniref:Uncharacterized protein n=1 Tax=Stylosanthes scabra TaxID=79078 RepID=A0ABU6RUS7_9FABA|nr:hypothetical protein [Stylosanthes scabra]
MNFPPILDERLWGEWNGDQVYLNSLIRRSRKGRPLSTRIRNEMDQTKPAPVCRCGKMKKGSLRSKERSLEAILPRVPRIGMEAGAYACFIMSKPRLGIP